MAAEIVEHPDHVEVVGRSGDDIAQALALLDAARHRQEALGRELEQSLLLAMTDAGMPALPPARATAAQRLAAHKQRLLAQGAFTYATLADARGAQESSVRTWASREKHSVLLLKDGGRTLLPAVQFDDSGQPRREIVELIQTLREVGLDSWQLWSWLVSPTGLLSGRAPAEIAAQAPARTRRAAQRYAGELRRRRGVAEAPDSIAPTAAPTPARTTEPDASAPAAAAGRAAMKPTRPAIKAAGKAAAAAKKTAAPSIGSRKSASKSVRTKAAPRATPATARERGTHTAS